MQSLNHLVHYIFYVYARTRRLNSVKLPASFAIERSAKANAETRMKCGGNWQKGGERERRRNVQEGERNGAAAVGETFVLEGKDYVCE